MIDPDKIEYYETATSGDDDAEISDNLSEAELIKGICDLLEERVQPFVQQDGGDVEFAKYDVTTGIVWLKLLGACSGCPKSSVTLNTQIKQLIMHYFPQVKDVMEYHDPDEENIPRAR